MYSPCGLDSLSGLFRAPKHFSLWGQGLQVLKFPLPFFLNKHSLDCCKPLVNFCGSENMNSANYAHSLVAFMEESISGGPYSDIFADVPSLTT